MREAYHFSRQRRSISLRISKKANARDSWFSLAAGSRKLLEEQPSTLLSQSSVEMQRVPRFVWVCADRANRVRLRTVQNERHKARLKVIETHIAPDVRGLSAGKRTLPQ